MMITAATRESFSPTLPLTDRRINVDLATRRIAVRIAGWNDAHSGLPGAVKMPRNVNVEAAHVGHVALEDGSTLPVANLPMGTMHAKQGLTAAQAAAMYENTGTSVARVRYSIDEEGIRADGLLFDDVDQSTLDRLIASAPSGDWRALSMVRRPEDFEHTPSDFAGACIVNIPGYSSTFSQSPATPMRLVASADSMILFDGEPEMEDDETLTGETLTGETPAEAPADHACPEGPPCDGCTCGRADDDETDALAASRIVALHAAIVADMESFSSLLAAGGYMDPKKKRRRKTDALTADGSMADAMAMMPSRDDWDAMLARIADLEQIVAEAILSY
jgi:hypothetical protein